jgi:acyl carrier protein
MDISHFLAKVEEVFVVEDKGSVTAETPIDRIGVMDSMAMLELQAFADAQLGVLMEPTDIIGCETVGDLWEAIQKKRASQA